MDTWEENGFLFTGERNCTLISYKGEESVLNLPKTSRNRKLAKVGAGAFEGNLFLEKIWMPDSVTEVEEAAFKNCRNLKEIHLSENLSSLPENVFFGCRNLSIVNIPDKLTHIPGMLFIHSCPVKIMIGKNVKEIKNRAFNGSCLQEVSVDKDNPYFISDGKGIYSKKGDKLLSLLVKCSAYKIKEGVERIGEHAFENSTGIKEIELPESLKIIDDYAFFSTEITKICFPKKLEKIGKAAFKFCRNLKSAELPDSLRVIGDESFFDSGLTKVKVPKNVAKIGINAFTIRKNEIDTRGVEDFSVDSNNPYYYIDNSALFYREKAGNRLLLLVKNIPSKYKIPEKTAFLSDDIFSYHAELTEAALPEGLKEIGNYTFYYSNLEKAGIPDTVEKIGNYAFYQTKIKEINIPASLKILGKNALSTRRNPEGGRFLDKVYVDPENPRFFVEQGALYAREKEGIALYLYFGKEESYYLPSYAAIIKEGAFAESSVEEVFLHREIIKIEKDAFIQCKELKRLIIELKDERVCSMITLFLPTLDMVYDDLNRYLNCIYYDGEGEVVDFEVYDSLFPIVRDWDEMIQVALSRLESPCSINPKGEEQYRRFIDRNFKNIYKRVINWENSRGLEILLEIKSLSKDQIETMLDYTRSRNSPKMIAFLLNYIKNNYASVEEDYEL